MDGYEQALDRYAQRLLHDGRSALAIAQELGADRQVFDNGRVRVVLENSPLANLEDFQSQDLMNSIEDLVERLSEQGVNPLLALLDSLHLRAPRNVLEALLEDLRLEWPGGDVQD